MSQTIVLIDFIQCVKCEVWTPKFMMQEESICKECADVKVAGEQVPVLVVQETSSNN